MVVGGSRNAHDFSNNKFVELNKGLVKYGWSMKEVAKMTSLLTLTCVSKLSFSPAEILPPRLILWVPVFTAQTVWRRWWAMIHGHQTVLKFDFLSFIFLHRPDFSILIAAAVGHFHREAGTIFDCVKHPHCITVLVLKMDI